MSTDPSETPRQLPERPNLRHLKEQAKDLLRSGAATSTADAQFRIARQYGFASWPKLKAHVDELVAADALERAINSEDAEEAERFMTRHPTLQAIVDRACGAGSWVKMKAHVAAQALSAQTDVGQLKRAIDTEDLDRVMALMTANPGLHRAPLGYGRNGPLTWVAECRVPGQPPSATRLAMAAWMIDHGSDVHQYGGLHGDRRGSWRGDRRADYPQTSDLPEGLGREQTQRFTTVRRRTSRRRSHADVVTSFACSGSRPRASARSRSALGASESIVRFPE